MLRNYFTVGLRSLFKNRVYALINILGLAIGMAACLMILLFVRYELGFDRWIPGVEHAYQFQSWYHGKDTGQPAYLQMTAYTAGKAFKKDFPEVEQEVYAASSAPAIVKDGQALAADDYLFADGNLLDVIRLPVVRGSAAGLAAIDTIALTQKEAIARLGSEDIVGRTVSLISKGETRDYRVVAVLKDIPRNSHIKLNAIVHVDFPRWMAKESQFLSCWGCQGGFVYVTLRPGADAEAMQARVTAWKKRNIPDDVSDGVRTNQGDDQDFRIVNLADIHLGRGQVGAMTPGNDERSIATFAVVALLILAMAVVNFTNLATARASQRAREVALRKVLGASRQQLIAQFVGEATLVAAIAMLVALAIVELSLPAFANFLDADLALHYFGRDGILLPVIGLVLLVGVLGGLYPAFFLSRFQPAAVLRANRSAAETPGSGRLRTILVVGQFAVSIGLIICTATIYAQTVYARTVDPGFRRDHILQINGLSRYQIIHLGDQLVERMRRVPGVDAVGRTRIGVSTYDSSNTGVLLPGATQPITLGSYIVDTGFKDAMGLELIAGRWFDRNRPMDDTTIPFPITDEAQKALAQRGGNVVINALAASKLGFAHPADAVGKLIRVGLVDNAYGLVPLTIVGVVKDSRFRSVRDPIDPIVFGNAHEGHSYMVIRYHGDPNAVRAAVERVWTGFTREVPFDAKFSEDIVGELYRAEEGRAKTFAGFAVLSVIVGCLGLFGLASFTAERRTKEIGIRKVLGARTRDIVRLLVWQFSRPVLVANLIAWPIAWWVMRDWLDRFDARITLGPGPFLAAGALALVIAVLTIGSHAVRVARANPINALRYE
ncbi:FtsX-like permease family protein [Sphingomonas sp. MMS24-J13]|uniref:ABC transporter permease n=1 Tax=Sphingomonas sp. MMS24-J13 TaxID=3238686 RepID=UPI003851026A